MSCVTGIVDQCAPRRHVHEVLDCGIPPGQKSGAGIKTGNCSCFRKRARQPLGIFSLRISNDESRTTMDGDRMCNTEACARSNYDHVLLDKVPAAFRVVKRRKRNVVEESVRYDY